MRFLALLQDICNYLDLEFSSINASMVSHQLNLATVSAEPCAFKAVLCFQGSVGSAG